jgi:hypothetical protein
MKKLVLGVIAFTLSFLIFPLYAAEENTSSTVIEKDGAEFPRGFDNRKHFPTGHHKRDWHHNVLHHNHHNKGPRHPEAVESNK